MNKRSRRTCLDLLSQNLSPGRLLLIAFGVCASGCLDFDQYGEGTGGTGGASIGGAPEGGGGGAPACPSDNFVPSEVCITGSIYDFDSKLADDWARTELGTVANGCSGSCASLKLGEGRLDLRTTQTAVLDECFASIDLISSNAERTFLELIPDGGASGSELPFPDRENNIEVAVSGNTVRFEIGQTSIPALTLDAEVMVDQLRIQVRANSVVLEAFAEGEQVACSEQARPAVLDQEVRAGFGIQGSSGQEAKFDNYGALID